MFGRNIERLQIKSGLSREEFAKTVLEITPQALGKLINSKNDPSLETLQKAAKYSGKTIDELIYEDEESSNIKKIKELIQKLNYTIREFADDIQTPASEMEKIIVYGIEPTKQVISSICLKYNIPISEFQINNDKVYETFCRAKENYLYIDLAMYIKEKNYDPEYVKNVLKVISLNNK